MEPEGGVQRSHLQGEPLGLVSSVSREIQSVLRKIHSEGTCVLRESEGT